MLALGKVYVFVDDAGPDTEKNALPVPPEPAGKGVEVKDSDGAAIAPTNVAVCVVDKVRAVVLLLVLKTNDVEEGVLITPDCSVTF
jgi:hypothetical protein